MERPASTAPGRSLEAGGNAGPRWMVAPRPPGVRPGPGTEPGLQAGCSRKRSLRAPLRQIAPVGRFRRLLKRATGCAGLEQVRS